MPQTAAIAVPTELQRNIDTATADQLDAARARLLIAKAHISNPKNWTQGVGARDLNGKPTFAKGVDACQWCASASLSYAPVNSIRVANLAREALTAVCRQWGYANIEAMNDHPETTHPTVMLAFDEAGKLLERPTAATGR